MDVLLQCLTPSKPSPWLAHNPRALPESIWVGDAVGPKRPRHSPRRDGSAMHRASFGRTSSVSGALSGFDLRFRIRNRGSLKCGARFPIVAGAGRKDVQFPPADFDFRAETREDTVAVVSSTYPALMDLVEDGTLVLVKRSEGYVERRVDGYREPEMVFLVGTSHMSLLSAAQVERVVESVRPENVVVELCRSRAGIMYEDASMVNSPADDSSPQDPKTRNLMSLSGENFGDAISRTLSLGGRSGLALRLLLGGMSQKISKSAGVATGAEFRAARKAAEEVGSQLVLGDRPIEVTVRYTLGKVIPVVPVTCIQLQRAWEALRWEERFRLAAIFLQAMLSSDLTISEEAFQVLKSDDVLSAMFSDMGLHLPSLLQPLVYERDMYLAWSLKRSKAVNGCSRVVGVVGRGHMRGVVYNLRHNQENLRFKDLVGTQKSEDKRSKGEKLVTNLVVEMAIGGATWFAWDQFWGK